MVCSIVCLVVVDDDYELNSSEVPCSSADIGTETNPFVLSAVNNFEDIYESRACQKPCCACGCG